MSGVAARSALDGTLLPGEAAPRQDRKSATIPQAPTPAERFPADPNLRQPSARDWFGFFSMVVGMFMAILDIQIVSASLTEIQAGLAASADEIAWVQTSYLIAEVVMIPLSGMLSRILSTRVLFVASAIGFTITSLGCAFAWSLSSMIVFRALQGFVGGAMIPTVFATSYSIFPPRRLAVVSTLIGLTATMAPTLGPTLGGFLTDTFSWHWLFLINILPGSFVAVSVWMNMDIDRPNPALWRGFDFAGVVLMALFLGGLEYALEEGPRQNWFDDESVLAATATSVLCGCLFFWRVLSYRQPIVDLRAYADRNFALGSFYSFIIGIGLYGAVYVLPLFLARVRGYNALQIGTTMIVTGIFQFVTAPAAGILTRKVDLRYLLAAGLGLFALSVWLNAGLTNQSAFGELILPQAVRGVALMFCLLPANMLALGTLSPEKLKNASGLYNLMRNLGGAIGLATINTLYTDRLAFHWNRLIENVNPARPEIQRFLDQQTSRLSTLLPGDPTHAATLMLGRLVQREATVLTFNDIFLLMAAVFLSGLVLMPLVRRPKMRVGGGH